MPITPGHGWRRQASETPPPPGPPGRRRAADYKHPYLHSYADIRTARSIAQRGGRRIPDRGRWLYEAHVVGGERSGRGCVPPAEVRDALPSSTSVRSALPSTRSERLKLARNDSRLSDTRSRYRANKRHTRGALLAVPIIIPVSGHLLARLHARRLTGHLGVARRVGQVPEVALLV